jgi:site-specific DNA-methyltransferase (adenine-specific)
LIVAVFLFLESLIAKLHKRLYNPATTESYTIPAALRTVNLADGMSKLQTASKQRKPKTVTAASKSRGMKKLRELRVQFDPAPVEKNYIEHSIGMGKIIHGDCADVLKDLPDNEFVLAFTSPPYLNAINYSQHVDKIKGQVERWEREKVSYAEYEGFLVARFTELLRVVKPGGHNIVNIAPVGWNGERVALPFHFVLWMERIGWKFREDIIWEKSIARDRRSGVLLQHPYPGYYYPSLVSEYVFVFQKPASKKERQNIYWNRTEEDKERNRLDLSEYQGEMSKNVWKIRPLSPQENVHPAPFPLELAERVVKLYSYEGDAVIDIFAGSGQTNLACERLHRRHVGIEILKEYVDYALKRLHTEGAQKRMF